ncbi:MAG TPA: hypothetical protein VMY35_13620 [Phycisphaerae bacterium]|nr:hypothetical protein [Phycisphaerae bacterium]
MEIQDPGYARNVVPVGPVLVAASGQALTCVADKTDYNVTVTAEAAYEVTAVNGRLHLGVAAVAAAAAIVPAAVLLTIPAGCSKRFIMPDGETTLHYATDSGAGITGRIACVG